MIYVIGARSLGCVKIGTTVDTLRRMADLQIANPVKLDLIAEFEGGPSEELRVHRILAQHRVRGEWFEREPAMRFIEYWECAGLTAALDRFERLREQDILAVSASRAQTREDVRRAVESLVSRFGPKAVAAAAQASLGSVYKWSKGHVHPPVNRLLGMLSLDPKGLDGVFDRFGFRIEPLTAIIHEADEVLS